MANLDFSSPGNAVRAACALFGCSLASSPALARPLFMAPEDFSLETLLADPLGLAIGATLLVAFVVGAWFVLRKAPLTTDIEQQRQDFLHALPANPQGYKAVLYMDEVFGMEVGAGNLRNHRILVELVHERPEKSKTLYRNEGIPSLRRGMYQANSSEASNLWLDAAAKHDLPAVCATRKGIQKLEERHFAELEKNRDQFLKKLHKRMWVNRKRLLS